MNAFAAIILGIVAGVIAAELGAGTVIALLVNSVAATAAEPIADALRWEDDED